MGSWLKLVIVGVATWGCAVILNYDLLKLNTTVSEPMIYGGIMGIERMITWS